MSRGVSSGGGHSSLGYLFGSKGEEPAQEPPPLLPSKVVNPPYGIDKGEDEENKQDNLSPEKQEPNINNYHRAEGQNSGNFITNRPSTKVKHVPGGNSSLGYLFGDK